MKEQNFAVYLDLPRFKKLETHIKTSRLTKRAFMEKLVDELPILALDATGRKK
jgi:hypothetical protein